MQTRFASLTPLFLAITAVACSRAIFAFIGETEGPNVLVVCGMAAILYLASLAVFLPAFAASLRPAKRIAASILLQILTAAGFYFWLR